MTETPDDKVELSTNQARQGQTPGVVRWVLGISLPLAIVAMFVVWWLS
jgi:hypothetical protein